MITRKMRDVLIEHIDGPVPVVVPNGPRGGRYARDVAIRARTIRALLGRRLIRGRSDSPRPDQTVLTEAGRAELAEALADWADAIVRARRDVGSTPLEDEAREVAKPKDLGEAVELALRHRALHA